MCICGLSFLLAMAGVAKLRRPAPSAAALRATGVPAPLAVTRALAVAELAVAVAGLSLPGRLAGAVVAGAFACLAFGAAAGGVAAGEVACGCFGDDAGAPLGRRHWLTNLFAALLAAGAAVLAPGAPLAAAAGQPLAVLAGLPAALVLALALRAWLRDGPRGLERPALALVDGSARALLEARFTRRTALVRVAMAGSALSIAPLRYLLYPGTAEAVVRPGQCGGGLCSDGYTEFCCEINQGLNTCPEGTFIGGWWMCTDYRGQQLCSGTGVRYYIDCNALPGRPFPGGCRCGDKGCDSRRVACNVFRYGQCNTHVQGTTAVVCRQISCENPGRVHGLGCSTAVMVDDATCGHEAACLEPPAVQLPGAGGA